jgi:hypothetical protein
MGGKLIFPLGRHRSVVHGAHRACDPTLRISSRGSARRSRHIGIVGQLVFGVYRAGQLWMGAAIRQLRLPSYTSPLSQAVLSAQSLSMLLAAAATGAHRFWRRDAIVARNRVGAATQAIDRQRAAATAAPDAWNSTGAARCRLQRLSEHHLRPARSVRSGPHRLALFQALLLIGWITRQPFAPSYWALTFGLAALAISATRSVERGAPEQISSAAPHVLTAVNLAVGGVAGRGCVAAAQGTTAPASASAGTRKPPPRAAGYIEYRRRSGARRIPEPLIPRIKSCGSRPHLPRHSNGTTLYIPGCGRPRLLAFDVWT